MTREKPVRGKESAKADESKKTDVVRAPLDVVEMLSTIAQHELNGWKSAAAILDDRECPLRDWLLPLYSRVIAEKAKTAAQIKKTSDG